MAQLFHFLGTLLDGVAGDDDRHQQQAQNLGEPVNMLNGGEGGEYYSGEDSLDGSDRENDSAEYQPEEELEEEVLLTITETARYYKEPSDLLSYVYALFLNEVTRPKLRNSDALEYLMPEANKTLIKQEVFKFLTYGELAKQNFRIVEACRPVAEIEDTFLVSKQLDLVYGRLIEYALLGIDSQSAGIARSLFQRRCQTLKPCRTTHNQDEKLCPLEWVLYTKINSPLYTFCNKQLQGNPMISHTLTPDYLNLEYLSFYLVLFLCGEHLNGMPPLVADSTLIDLTPTINTTTTTTTKNIQSYHYTDINQWLKVPLSFLDMWYANHSEIIKI